MKSKSKKSTASNAKKVLTKKKGTHQPQLEDIITLILRDHQPIKELIEVLKDPDESIDKKRPAFAEFEKKLLTHAKAEQETLYMEMKEQDETRVEAMEGDVEHSLAEQLIQELDSTSDDDLWMAKVKVLAEVVEHHVDEEEKEVLKEARKNIDVEQRIELGKAYLQLMEQSGNNGSLTLTQRESTRTEYQV